MNDNVFSSIPLNDLKNSVPKISVIGVGGAGCNAVNSMIDIGIEGVNFIATNTDMQSLNSSNAEVKIQLGAETTQGFGAGSNPEIGEMAANESANEILDSIKNTNILFLTAGMGGGTGSGAVPVIAGLAKSKNILTIAVVTTPFDYESDKRKNIAIKAIEKLMPNVDAYIILPNENLFKIPTENTKHDAMLKMSDAILSEDVKSITDLINIPGIMNLDFADIKNVMVGGGKTIIGSAIKSGENRAIDAINAIFNSPMIMETDFLNAKSVLVNITANPENLDREEPKIIMNTIKTYLNSEDTDIVHGICYDKQMGDSLKVAVIATGLGGVKQTENDFNFLNSQEQVKKQIPEIEDVEPVKNMGQRLDINNDTFSTEPKIDLSSLSGADTVDESGKQEPSLNLYKTVTDDTDPDDDPTPTKKKTKESDNYLEELMRDFENDIGTDVSDNDTLFKKEDETKLFSDNSDLQIGIKENNLKEKDNIVPISSVGLKQDMEQKERKSFQFDIEDFIQKTIGMNIPSFMKKD